MSQSDETSYTVRNYEALDNQVAEMAAREAEETRRLRYVNFFRLAQIFAIVCLAMGLLFVLAGWGIKMARSYKQEVIYKGSELQRDGERIDAPAYYGSENGGSSFEKITISETEKARIAKALDDPDTQREVEAIFEEQNNVASRIDILESEREATLSRVEGELELSRQSNDELEKLISENPELASLKKEINNGSVKFDELEETSSENLGLKKNFADGKDLDPDQDNTIAELGEVYPVMADKASVAASSAAQGDEIVKQLEEQNRELSEEKLSSMALTADQQEDIEAIAAENPELAQEVADALRASNAVEGVLRAAESENEEIRQEQGLAPAVDDNELAQMKEALQDNPQLADKIEEAVTKPNTFSQEALAEENESLKDQLQTAGKRNEAIAKKLADVEEANELMERNFEAGLNDQEKNALAPVLEKNPSLKNKIGAALNPEPGTPQDLANKAAEAQKESKEAKAQAAEAEERAAQAEQALEQAQQAQAMGGNGEAYEKGFSQEEKAALEPILEENPELKQKLSRVLEPEEGSQQDLANQVADAMQAAKQAQDEANNARKRAEEAERALAGAQSDDPSQLEGQLEKAQQDLEKANEELREARANVEKLENERPESLAPDSMDELLKDLTPGEREELEALMAKSPDLLEALKRQAAEEARRAMNLDVKENVMYQNREISSGIPGYTITTWFDFAKATDQKTSSRRCALARKNDSGIVGTVRIAEQIGNEAPVMLDVMSISATDLLIALPKCAWRTD
jgi:hypothetical protein